jgi:hypothetical protein
MCVVVEFPQETFHIIWGFFQISAHVSCCRIPSGNLLYYMFIIHPGLYCNHLVRPSVCPSVHTFVTDISASTGRNDFIFDIWLWHGDLYRVSPFQVYCTSTSCLPNDLEFFMFAAMKTFVTDISASTRRNDLICGFGMVTCTMSPLSRFTAHLLPVYRVT